jgi:phytoene synthase
VNDLDASYALCQRLARRSASNFYFSFWLLAREKRRAMCALYAFLRHVDDLGDDERRDVAARRAALAEFRQALQDALSGKSGHPILPALVDTVERYRIPHEYLTEAIDGVEMDLMVHRYETFTELEKYCWLVASAVGLACIHIWGFHDRRALEPARRCGVAFQLTNILRDLREDSDRGRIYLPQEDLQRFAYSAEELAQRDANDRFLNLMHFEIARAERFYDSAAALEPFLEPDGRRVFRAMASAYRRLLGKIQQRPTDALRRRVRLNAGEKLRIAANAFLDRRAPAHKPSNWETASS